VAVCAVAGNNVQQLKLITAYMMYGSYAELKAVVLSRYIEPRRDHTIDDMRYQVKMRQKNSRRYRSGKENNERANNCAALICVGMIAISHGMCAPGRKVAV